MRAVSYPLPAWVCYTAVKDNQMFKYLDQPIFHLKISFLIKRFFCFQKKKISKGFYYRQILKCILNMIQYLEALFHNFRDDIT